MTKRNMKKNLILIVSVFMTVVLCGCGKKNDNTEQENNSIVQEEFQTETEAVEAKQSSVTYSTWIAYWDYDTAFEEADVCGDALSSIAAFEVLYEQEDLSFYFPDKTLEVLEQIKKKYGDQKSIYLSFVNDVHKQDDTYIQKDPEMVHQILETEEMRHQHIDNIVQCAKKLEVDGIELDYEHLLRVDGIEESLPGFLEELAQSCKENDLELRVDLESGVIKRISLPEEIPYVVMCYNLYGYGTEPGPKADQAFLTELCENYRPLQQVTMAFSTGGFDWVNGKVSRALTEKQALELAKEQNVQQINRDLESQCAFFIYEKDGEKHDVWYADAETLCYWKSIVVEQGYDNIAIWRMNGNSEETLSKLCMP